MIILGFFALGALGAVGMLAGIIPIPKSANEAISGPVVIWGTRPKTDFEFVDTFIQVNYKNVSVKYIQKNIQTFESELNEAIASGRSPDLIVISQEQLLRNRSKIRPVSVNQDALFSFSQTYINGADVFLYNNSILAYPLALEPLVMFYNDRLLTSAGYAFPPRTWSELQSYSSTLTKVDDNRNIESSLVALGTFDNMEYPLDIVSTLLMQVGTKIINRNTSTSDSGVSTNYVANVSGNAAEQVFDFYTAFTNPNKRVYSWNASMPRDIDAFAQEKTSLWFGYPSDAERLRRKNPNLNFKIAEMPQVENGDKIGRAHV